MIADDEKVFCLYQNMVEKRHEIWVGRQNNVPPPWTDDPVLAKRKFTNMFRVLDPGSQFVFELDNGNPVDVISRLVFYRITNLPSTWGAIQRKLGRYPLASDFVHESSVLYRIIDDYRNTGGQVFSGAYIIIPEPGTANDKVSGALRVTREFATERAGDFLKAESQVERFNVLRSTPGLGKFLSMQVLADWGYLQSEEPDQSFIVAGPGAVRGAQLISSRKKPEDVIRELMSWWEGHPFVHVHGRSLGVMDVQNTMCEFGKYAREMANPRKKTAYQPAHPGIQPRPVLPRWW